MNFFSQPCVAPSESTRLGAKQDHAKSAKAATNIYLTKNNPFRSLRPWREQSPTPHAKSAKAATHTLKLHSHFRTLRSSARFTETKQSRAAFSLTEVVIAMGVAAVAFTSIIALFPLGLSMSKESYEETQAALLAQTILSDLRDNISGTNSTNRLIQIGPDNSPFATKNYIAVDTSKTYLAPITCYVAYNQETRTDTLYRDVELRPFEGSLSKPPWWDTGNPKATTLAMITVSATFRADSTIVDNPQRVDVCIESPGNLPAAGRKQFLFTGGVAP